MKLDYGCSPLLFGHRRCLGVLMVLGRSGIGVTFVFHGERLFSLGEVSTSLGIVLARKSREDRQRVFVKTRFQGPNRH